MWWSQSYIGVYETEPLSSHREHPKQPIKTIAASRSISAFFELEYNNKLIKQEVGSQQVFHNNFSSPLNKLPLATQQEQNVHPISIDNQYKKDL